MEDKRILTVQDLSCLGQCSLTVALPVLSAWGHETCVLPTAILSTHTGGFGQPEIVPMEEALEGFWRHWQRNGITFDAVLVGYLGSAAAVRTVEELLDRLLKPEGLCIVDPAMADHGRLYSGLDGAYVDALRGLCHRADVLLPNLTEAALLTGAPYQEAPGEDALNRLLDALPAPCAIVTGVERGERTGAVLRQGDTRRAYFHHRVEGRFSGAGDLFAACFTGALLRGRGVYEALCLAADFTHSALEYTVQSPARPYGLRFEQALPGLMKML